MTVVRFFRLSEIVIEWMLAIALSFAIDACIAGIVLYAGWWSPSRILGVLIGFCFIGVSMQFVAMRFKTSKPVERKLKEPLIVPTKEQENQDATLQLTEEDIAEDQDATLHLATVHVSENRDATLQPTKEDILEDQVATLRLTKEDAPEDQDATLRFAKKEIKNIKVD
jgi:hypothetical protein